LPDSANVFNDVIRHSARLFIAIESAPPEPDLPNSRRKPRTLSPFWLPIGWGLAATIALAAVAASSQTEIGSRRLRLALAATSEPVRAVALIPPDAAETEAEFRRLAAQVRALAADRERLSARIASLERNRDDVTGSIKQRAAQAADPAAESSPLAPSALAFMPAATFTQLPPAVEPMPEPIPQPPLRSEFGIDLGGGPSVEALRVHWAAMKASYGPLLTGLHPLVAQRQRRPAGIDYRLVAGPLPHVAAAAQLCARFPITRAGCRPAKFNGVYLAEH
jgi:hypothetical protein